jgi:anaerobic ribonucleoside-triphosphate reductase activating protein
LDKQRELLEDMQGNPLLQGVTLCGGDPFYAAEELAPFVAEIRRSLPHFDVWSYTGFTFEQLREREDMLGLLQLCDVIIDGRFVEEQKDLTLLYRGSSNQRILDVKASLAQRKAVTAPGFL